MMYVCNWYGDIGKYATVAVEAWYSNYVFNFRMDSNHSKLIWKYLINVRQIRNVSIYECHKITH